MVRDDQIDAELARAARGVGAANAAVYRDDQRNPVGMQALDGYSEVKSVFVQTEEA